ncbi:hypothetical protein [Cryobacterium sp. Y57]|uniref:hypothetical protein n=1 Tax=Cryobacterium sp. Y57 TaxID=2048287 RepID=UPI000CE43A47|nr:hypothetical protein [Cryobacterium sp. Y57]
MRLLPATGLSADVGAEGVKCAGDGALGLEAERTEAVASPLLQYFAAALLKASMRNLSAAIRLRGSASPGRSDHGRGLAGYSCGDDERPVV